MLLFLIPIILIAAVVSYAIIEAGGSQNGKLIVEAQSSSRYYSPRSLNVDARVNGLTGTTPFNLTLAQGTYTVTFLGQRWYNAPPAKTVNVTAGKSSFVVGTYSPIVDFVSVAGGEFNASATAAMHGVTPVVWVNPTTEYVVIQSTPTGTVAIPPMGNYTFVFQHAGTYGISLPLTSSPNQVVTVS